VLESAAVTIKPIILSVYLDDYPKHLFPFDGGGSTGGVTGGVIGGSTGGSTGGVTPGGTSLPTY